jgi:hypothetical protein
MFHFANGFDDFSDLGRLAVRPDAIVNKRK